MKRTKFYSVCLILLMLVFPACSGEETDSLTSGSEERVQVSFDALMPLESLPFSKSLSTSVVSDNYEVWVFNNRILKERLNSNSTYKDSKNVEHKKLRFNRNEGKLYLMLPEEYTEARIMMIANINDFSKAPNLGITWQEAEQYWEKTLFAVPKDQNVNNEFLIPMYGVNSKEFAVSLGASGGVISLLRSVAKIEILAAEAADHFKLTSVEIYKSAIKGTVKSTILVPQQPEPTDSNSILGKIDQSTNSGTIYVPEMSLGTGYKIFLIIEGEHMRNKNKTSKLRYRLDFIERPHQTETGHAYKYIDRIERNCRYSFQIDYLPPTAGYGKGTQISDMQAANSIPEGKITMKTINNPDIMDITTDNYFYLGVTQGVLKATLNSTKSHYYVNISVLTNNSSGWKFEQLPSGVEVTQNEWSPHSSQPVSEVQSIWAFFDTRKFTSGQSVMLYIFSGNIRKGIKVIIP